MTSVALKIYEAGTYSEVVRSKLPFSRIENGTVVLSSQLGSEASINEHLVWLWGMVKNERRVLKSAVDSGARITCECSVQKGPIRLLANASEMLHLLGAELLLQIK